jgi:heat-inducible transcriptional repressor
MLLADLTERSQMILRLAVDAYMTSGEPVGSRSLSRILSMAGAADLSAATIRNTMADLEEAGLLYAPHTSAGRLPTSAGLRLFVDGLLEVGQLNAQERTDIEQQLGVMPDNVQQTLERASTLLSGLSQCAGLVAAPKKNQGVQQIEFVSLSPQKILAVLVRLDGSIENRLIETGVPLPSSVLQRASNYLNARLGDQAIDQAATSIRQDIAAHQADIDHLTAQLVEAGLAESLNTPDSDHSGTVIVRGKAHLLNDIKQIDELERLRRLFATLEERQTVLQLVEQTEHADGVQIFIGSDNAWFNHAGCSLIVAPYKNKQQQVVGALGVIGPTRMAYGRIIPLVDFTARLMTRMLQA